MVGLTEVAGQRVGGVLPRHGPAARGGRGPARGPAHADPRRAGQRPRPRRHPLDPRAADAAGRRGPHGVPVLAPDERDGGDRRPRDRHRRRAGCCATSRWPTSSARPPSSSVRVVTPEPERLAGAARAAAGATVTTDADATERGTGRRRDHRPRGRHPRRPRRHHAVGALPAGGVARGRLPRPDPRLAGLPGPPHRRRRPPQGSPRDHRRPRTPEPAVPRTPAGLTAPASTDRSPCAA